MMAFMRTSGLSLAQLQLVDTLARNGNLTDAAKQLGLTQPAASRALARLRQELQDPIFVRTSEGMRPTPYGKRLAAAVHDAVRVLRDGMEREENFAPATCKRTFNVFMSDVGQLICLPPILKRLSVVAPGVTLRVRPFPFKAAHLSLESGDVDAAIGTYTTIVSGCRQKRLYQGQYVCIAREDHPHFVHGMTAEAFREVPHAIADATGYIHEMLDRWLARQNIRRNVKLHVPHYLVLPLLVAQSDVIAITASGVADLFASLVPLKVMGLPIKVPEFDIKLFWHERFHRDPVNRWFRDLVSSTLKD